MNEDTKDYLKIFICLLVGAAIVGLGLRTVKSHYEAEAFNRLTGGNATAWDAFWVELRVQDSNK